jgi:RNA polymerase-binding transcription factor DksA
MNWLWQWVFFWRCPHRRETWPQTREGRTYRVCLDCGRERDTARLEVSARPR